MYIYIYISVEIKLQNKKLYLIFYFKEKLESRFNFLTLHVIYYM